MRINIELEILLTNLTYIGARSPPRKYRARFYERYRFTSYIIEEVFFDEEFNCAVFFAASACFSFLSNEMTLRCRENLCRMIFFDTKISLVYSLPFPSAYEFSK